VLLLSTLSFRGGNAGDILAWPHFFSTTRDWDSSPRAPTKRPSRGVASCWSANWNSFMVNVWWWSATFSSCISGILDQRVSGTTDRPTWTESMACSFHSLQQLWFLSLGCLTSTVHATDVSDAQVFWQRIHDILEIICLPGIFQCVRHSFYQRATSCVDAQVGHVEKFL